jgi:hypothetical protein
MTDEVIEVVIDLLGRSTSTAGFEGLDAARREIANARARAS